MFQAANNLQIEKNIVLVGKRFQTCMFFVGIFFCLIFVHLGGVEEVRIHEM